MVMETKRLTLRKFTPEDFDVVYEMYSDPETMTHYPKPYDEEMTKNWIAWNIQNYQDYGFGIWAVISKETGEYIGDCGITMQDIDGDWVPEIGYHIHKKCWRQGYGLEAAKAVRDWFFETREFDSVYSYMKYTNVPSYSLAMANGMKKVKEYPEERHEKMSVYVITREEWEALRGKE